MLLVDMLTDKLAAGFEIVTTQVVADPAVTSGDRQLTEDTVGVDHSVRLALCDETPSAAFTLAVPSDAMSPIATTKVTAVSPPATVTLAGTLTAVDGELKLTTAFEAAGCDSCTVHEVVARDMTPFGLQLRPVSAGSRFRLIAMDCAEPL